MLTITETVDAINAIDTDNDIVLGACKRILGLDTQPKGATPRDIAQLIVNTLQPYSAKDGLSALSIAIASSAIALAEPGHETDLLKDLLGEISHYFTQSMMHRLMKKFGENPDEAMAELLQMVRNKG
jgi:thiamine phosphate synthase YjbQ (UPF0047 family)